MTTAIPQISDDYAALIAEASAAAMRALDEARLPIHILLTTQFGALNENQEELLDAARRALEHMDTELRALAAIAEADRGSVPVNRASVRIGDVLRSLLPALREQAARSGITLGVTLEPALPSVVGDAARLRDALRLTLADDIRYATPGTAMTITAHSTTQHVVITSRHGSIRAADGRLALAQRLLSAQGGWLEHADGTTTLGMPRAVVEATQRA